MYLEKIDSPNDLKSLHIEDLSLLAKEMRESLITKISKRGGHLGSNLGIVELTIALHYVYNSPIDKFVFDVSHQSYCHKMLTGRKDAFLDAEKYSTVTGFSEPKESKHDFFNIGHTSTAISLAIGLSKGRDVLGGNENVIAIIGDGSLGGGQAFEGLNYAAEYGKNLIIILNDNDMSIAENHGGLYFQLEKLRSSKGLTKDNYFKSLGLDYCFVEDGHDIKALIDVFSEIKGIDHPIVVHVCTTKGKGYSYAEKDKEKWHQSRPFDIPTGKFLTNVPKENYGAIVGDYLLEKMKKDKSVVVVTAGTSICVGFNQQRRELAGDQFIDVGIEEQNAVSIAAGIAKRGGKAVFATNSTFIQRAYDQIEQELCISSCPATLIVTHASVYGHTTVTHMGLFDIPLLANIPNLLYLAPTNKDEYLAMLDWSIEQNKYPVAIRVPWNGVHKEITMVETDFSDCKGIVTRKGERVAIIAVGSFYQLGEEVVSSLSQYYGINATLINPRCISMIDCELLDELQKKHKLIVTMEDGYVYGGYGSKIASFYGTNQVKVMTLGVHRGIDKSEYNVKELLYENKLTKEQIVESIMNQLHI